MFNIRNRQFTIWGMIAILFFSVLIVTDLVFLPYEKSVETIEYAELVTQGSMKEVVGYRYRTNQGTSFTLDKDYIRGDGITLERTLLFKQIIDVKTSTRDYTPLLSSGFNGFTLFWLVFLAISCGISLFNLWGNEPMTVNRYQNFVMFTAFIFFCTVSVWFVFN